MIASNKGIYGSDEKVIIVGVVPDGFAEERAVLIQVTGPGGQECAKATVLPDGSDNSFVSRPLQIGDDCGLGVYTVAAYYADLKATSTFQISENSRDGEIRERLELRMIKNVVLRAQEVVNSKLKEIVGNNTIAEEIANKLNEGAYQASLTLQAAENGNIEEAKKHQILTMRIFREVFNTLLAAESNSMTLSVLSARLAFNSSSTDADNEKDDIDNITRVQEKWERIQEFYDRLSQLAEKNGLDKSEQFDAVLSLLSDIRDVISKGNFDDASKSLERASGLLDDIRQDLLEETKDKNIETALNETEKDAEEDAEEEDRGQEMSAVAEKLERRANALLEDAAAAPDVIERIRQALSHIADAKIDIQNEEYDSARQDLATAFTLLNEAREMLKDQNENDDSDESDDSQSSDSGRGGDDNDDEGKDRDEDDDEDSDDDNDKESSEQ